MGEALHGVVRCEDGSAASHALVFLNAAYQTIGEPDPDLHPGPRMTDQAGRPDTEEHGTPVHEPVQTTTDGDGRYAFDLIPGVRRLGGGQVEVWAALGELVSPKVLVSTMHAPVRIPPLTLGPAIRPTIRIVTSDGAPVVDAHVALTLYVEDQSPAARRALMYCLGARTNHAGIVTLPTVPRRSDWKVWINVNPIEMPRHVEGGTSAPRLGSEEPLEILISRGCTVRGQIELPDGRGGAGVTVSSRPDRWPPNAALEHSTVAREDGSFEMRGVPTEAALLTFSEMPALAAESPGPGRTRRSRQSCALSLLTKRICGKEDQVIDVGMVRLPPTLAMSGTVLGSTGEPADMGHVSVPPSMETTPLGPGGTFSIPGLEAGVHTLKATVFEGPDPWEGGLKATFKNLEAGAEGFVIQVTGGGNLTVRLHPAGEPSTPLEVRTPSICWGRLDSGGLSFCGETSVIKIELEPGRRSDIRIQAKGFKTSFLGPIEIHADRETVVHVESEPEE